MATQQITTMFGPAADVLIAWWDKGKPDITVAFPLTLAILGESSKLAGAAALAAETRKLLSYGPKCQELGWPYISMAVETYENRDKEALSRLHLAVVCPPKSISHGSHILEAERDTAWSGRSPKPSWLGRSCPYDFDHSFINI